MSIESKNTIDYISEENGAIILTISDHLTWGELSHLYVLQEKINTYISAIESGKVYDYCPNANNGIVINVVLQYYPDEQGSLFLKKISDFITNQGYKFQYSVLTN